MGSSGNTFFGTLFSTNLDHFGARSIASPIYGVLIAVVVLEYIGSIIYVGVQHGQPWTWLWILIGAVGAVLTLAAARLLLEFVVATVKDRREHRSSRGNCSGSRRCTERRHGLKSWFGDPRRGSRAATVDPLRCRLLRYLCQALPSRGSIRSCSSRSCSPVSSWHSRPWSTQAR